MVGHVGLHEVVGGARVAGEDETFGEGGIEATVVGSGKPDEVFRTVVGSDAVEVVAIVGMDSSGGELGRWRKPFDGSGSDESEGDGMMDEDVAVAVRHLVINLLSVTVLFALRPGGMLGSELVVSAMMEGVENSFGRGKEGVSAGS